MAQFTLFAQPAGYRFQPKYTVRHGMGQLCWLFATRRRKQARLRSRTAFHTPIIGEFPNDPNGTGSGGGIRPSSIKRRLAAIAFADVAGFSRLIALNDVETLRRWKELRTEVMEPRMERHGGRVTQMAGDAVLVEFGAS